MKWPAPEGATIKVKHLRRSLEGPEPMMTTHELKESGLTPHPQGGRTEVVVELDGKTSLGVAECSERDNYNRAVGRYIATGRALKLFHGGYPVAGVDS